jgi:hypothetical protein
MTTTTGKRLRKLAGRHRRVEAAGVNGCAICGLIRPPWAGRLRSPVRRPRPQASAPWVYGPNSFSGSQSAI